MLRIFSFVVCLLVCTCGTANAAPTVTGASVGSTSITVTGSGFGSTGPSVVIFDDFDAVGASNGANISLTADVGTWDGTGTYSPTYDSLARSGSYSAEMSVMDPKSLVAKVYKNFSPVTEFYVSYAVQVPTGTWFPHTGKDGTHDGGDGLSYLSSSTSSFYSNRYVNTRLQNLTDGSECKITTTTETTATCTLAGGTRNNWNNGDSYRIRIYQEKFPEESVWKFTWIRDYINDPDASPDDDDICVPSHISGGQMRNSGNGLNSSLGSASAFIYNSVENHTWWKWGSWNRISNWSKADTTNPSTANGIDWAQGIGEGFEQYQASDTTHPTFYSGTAPYQWTRFDINGWIRDASADTPVRLLYDDVYFATGPNSAARVEIGNNATYTSCTQLAIQTPTSWADGSVTVDLRKGGFADGATVYVFVIDKDNVPSSGRQITLPGGGPSISGVSGTLANGQALTISGTGFGTHANNNPDSKGFLPLVWENFESGAGDASVFNGTNYGPELVSGGATQKTNSNYSGKAYHYNTERTYTNVFGQSKTGRTVYNIQKNLSSFQKKIFISGWYMFPTDFPLNISSKYDVLYQVKLLGLTPYPPPSGPRGAKTYFQTRSCSPTGGPACTDQSQVVLRTETEDGHSSESHGSLTGWSPLNTWHRLDIYVDLNQPDGQKIHNWYVDGKKISRTNQYYNNDAQLTADGVIDGFNYLNWAWYFPYQPTDDNNQWPIYFDDAFANLTQARVEISESATWSEAVQTNKNIQIPTSWSDTSISATVNLGNFDTSSPLYLYVIHDDGSVSPAYQIRGAGGGGGGVKKVRLGGSKSMTIGGKPVTLQ